MTAPATQTRSTQTTELETLDFPSEGPGLLEAILAQAPARLKRGFDDIASPEEIERAMANFDADEMVRDIAGEAIDTWFYAFPMDGKEVVGVSAKGAHEFARLRAEQGFPIVFPRESVQLFEATQNGILGIRAIVTARDYRTRGEGLGTAFYPYATAKRDGTKVSDRFPDRKALNVAERNRGY